MFPNLKQIEEAGAKISAFIAETKAQLDRIESNQHALMLAAGAEIPQASLEHFVKQQEKTAA